MFKKQFTLNGPICNTNSQLICSLYGHKRIFEKEMQVSGIMV